MTRLPSRTAFFALVLMAVAVGGWSPRAVAGPVIIDGTDSNDHGSGTAKTNSAGWKYMERVLDNLATASSLNASAPKVLVNLGAASNTQAGNAIANAFALSILPSLGWSIQNVVGASQISAYLSTASTANSAIIAITTYNNTVGDLTAAEMAAVNANAANINTFVGQGGGLFAMGESNSGTDTGAFGWLSTLVPGLTSVDDGTGGIDSAITLTAAGTANFPGLSNADLSTGPWHAHFTGNLGGLAVLATSTSASGAPVNLILGANVSGGSIITGVPEPASLISLGLGGVVLLGRRLRSRRRSG